MPESVIIDKVLDQIPRFIIPKGGIETKTSPAAAPPVEKEVVKEEVKKEALNGEIKELVEIPDVLPTPEKDASPPDDEATKRQNAINAQRRQLNRAKEEKREALAKAEALELKLRELEAKQVPATSVGAPRMEDFTDVQEYAKAYGAFEKKNAIAEYEKKQRDTAETLSQKKLTDDWDSKVSRAAEKYPDFDEKVGDLKPTAPWARALMQADNGEEIAYYLGTHVKEAQKIISLDAYGQVREIGKLEMKLSATPEAPKKPSKAPPPIAPVTGTGQQTDEYQPGMSHETYLKWRKKNLPR